MTSEWARRRWKEVTVLRTALGCKVLLDGCPLRTPGGTCLVVPSAMLARAIASEWSDEMEGPPNPVSFMMTRLANTVVDLTDSARETMTETLLDYLSSDGICYRASGPPDLVERQQDSWDPILERYSHEWGQKCLVTTGILPISQPESLHDAVLSRLTPMNAFELVVTTEQVTLTTSLLLVLALRQGWIDLDETWRLSQLDTEWQRERWGPDEDDEIRLTAMRNHFLQASAFLAASEAEDVSLE